MISFSRSLILVVLILGFTVRMEAYVDPGAGSMILQGILGAIAAGSAVVIAYWRSIRTFFSKGTKDQKRSDD